MSTIKVDTVRPVTADASLTLQGDNSGTGVSGITIDSSGNATLAGTGNNIGTVTVGTLGSSVDIKASINASGSAPIYACRAWVNFNGTGTVAIREAGNVSSLADNNTGDYTVNFSTAMPDANYCAVIFNGITSTLHGIPTRGGSIVSYSNSAIRVSSYYMNTTSIGVAEDGNYSMISIFR